MLDLILTIVFFVSIFGSLGYFIYRWSNSIANNKNPRMAVKDPDKFGCH